MLKVERGAVTVDNGVGKAGLKVIRTESPCHRTSGERLTSIREGKHLSLVEGAARAKDSEMANDQTNLPQYESTSSGVNGELMAKRQQQERRVYSDEETKPGEGPGFDTSLDAPTIKREFILTQSADDTLHDVVRLFSRATGSNLTNSHFIRVLLRTITHAMPELDREVRKLGKLERPSNSREGQEAREQYERRLAVAVVSALRHSPPFDADETPRRKHGDTRKRSA